MNQVTIKYETPQFPIGTRFIPYGLKTKQAYEVIDVILSVSHATGKVSHMLTYVAETEFMGQTIRWECPQATIARSEKV